MKIKLLGTGSISSTSYSASAIVNNNTLIDTPNGIYKKLLKEKVELADIEYVIFTHFHGDHFFDIPFILLGRNDRKNKKPLTFIGNRDTRKKILQITKLAFPHSYIKVLKEANIKYVNCNRIKNFDIGNNVKVNSFKVKHGHMTKANGYSLKYNYNIVVFTGDTSLCKEVEEQANKANYVILDTTKKEGNEAHLGVDNIKYLASKYKNVKFILTHKGPFSEKLLKDMIFINNNVINPMDDYEFNV